jgi:chromosome partitioning protein
MEKKAVFANQKGGVGKTTCAVNIGFELARRGHSVLLVDLDPQANMTSWCGHDPDELDNTVYSILKNGDGISDTILDVKENVDLVPANILLASIEHEIFSQIGYERRLKKAFESIEDTYSHILMDCPPSLGALTVNGLVAADEVYITVACEHLSVIGTSKLVETIDAVRDNYNPDLEIGKVIPTMYMRTVLADEMIKQLKDFFGDNLTNTVIRRNVKIGESSAMQKSVMEYAPGSAGAQDYKALVEELL